YFALPAAELLEARILLAAGALDTTFDGDGKVTTTNFGYTASDAPMTSAAESVVIQPDGKILIAGSSGVDSNLDFAVARYNTDGSLDATFGSGGTVVTSLS